MDEILEMKAITKIQKSSVRFMKTKIWEQAVGNVGNPMKGCLRGGAGEWWKTGEVTKVGLIILN